MHQSFGTGITDPCTNHIYLLLALTKGFYYAPIWGKRLSNCSAVQRNSIRLSDWLDDTMRQLYAENGWRLSWWGIKNRMNRVHLGHLWLIKSEYKSSVCEDPLRGPFGLKAPVGILPVVLVLPVSAGRTSLQPQKPADVWCRMMSCQMSFSLFCVMLWMFLVLHMLD